jgi:hypothetical protein
VHRRKAPHEIAGNLKKEAEQQRPTLHTNQAEPVSLSDGIPAWE